MKKFEEFIADLKNCKNTDEVIACLSTGDAISNYSIRIFKRENFHNDAEKTYERALALSDFLTQWIEDNEGFFMDDDIQHLINLIRATHNYLVSKDNKGWLTAIQRPSHKQRLNNTKKYQESVRTHLEAVKRDLEEICPQGGKTKILLNSINEALNDMDSIVPIVKIPKANTDELTEYLTYLENETGISKEATRNYKKFFQGYYNLKIADNFRFPRDANYITS
ncbi:MAG: hypothetical protein A3J96_08305 [Sulfurimonas sp. RIFOXYC2_FULL_36_7]|nr:MAG: hypothetical protein A3J96_08305 [Sulfurimonas sp. RIFOXYC2_FULL_36_7]